MKNRIWKAIDSVALAIVIVSCGGQGAGDESPNDVPPGTVSNPIEVFTDADAPARYALKTFESSLRDDQEVEAPWGYNRTDNRDRRYPMVVGGCWDDIDGFSLDTRKRYPAFYVDFTNYSGESDGVTLAAFIDEMIRLGYRIDANRIYLTGFSAGGSGSFKIVRGMLSQGKLFAAINRQAGQSETVMPDAAVEKTSIWYHIGLEDETPRITVARETYANLKGHPSNDKATERTETDTRTSYARTTKTLTLNGIEIVKYSEYPNVGHWSPCYNDPSLFEWLFSQSLSIR